MSLDKFWLDLASNRKELTSEDSSNLTEGKFQNLLQFVNNTLSRYFNLSDQEKLLIK